MDPSLKSGNLQTPKQSAKPLEDAEFCPLSGKPYFYIVLGDLQHRKRFQPAIPREVSEKLPTCTVPAKLVYRGNVWDLLYHGDQSKKRFGNEGWGKFVSDNKLENGDACVIELMKGNSKSSVVKFKVHILKSNFPSELLMKAEGFNENNPIEID